MLISALVFPLCRGTCAPSLTQPVLSGKSLFEVFESVQQAAINDIIAELHPHPTDHGRVHGRVQFDSSTGCRVQRLLQPTTLRGAERNGGGDRRELESALIGNDRGSLPEHGTNPTTTRILHEVAHNRDRGGVRSICRAKEPVNDSGFCLRGAEFAPEREFQFSLGGDGTGEAQQLTVHIGGTRSGGGNPNPDLLHPVNKVVIIRPALCRSLLQQRDRGGGKG